MTTTLSESLKSCRAITRRSRSSFRFAFRQLPRNQRDAMHAVYAAFRLSDDIGDAPDRGRPEQRRTELAAWRAGLVAAFEGRPTHPIHPALAWAVKEFAIPQACFFDLLDGVESDLGEVAMADAGELRRYTYRVASTVGLACIRIWGLRTGATWEAAEQLAIEAGHAFQLTNIVRDFAEDVKVGRRYLPGNAEPQELIRAAVKEARESFRTSAALEGLLALPGRKVFQLMGRAYRKLLERVEKSGFDPARRVRLSKFDKFRLAVNV